MQCSFAIARAMPRCIRIGSGTVLSFYVNSTRQTSNLASKKSTIPQDYFKSLIPCGPRGAISCNLTVSELWTIYNFPSKISIYKVKRQFDAIRCWRSGQAIRCRAIRPGDPAMRYGAGKTFVSSARFKQVFQAGG